MIDTLDAERKADRHSDLELAGRRLLAREEATTGTLCAYAAGLRRRGRPVAAVFALRHAEQLASGSRDWRVIETARGAALREDGDPVAALSLLEAAESRHGRDRHLDVALVGALRDLAVAGRDASLIEEASRRAKRAYAEDPDDQRTRRVLNQIGADRRQHFAA